MQQIMEVVISKNTHPQKPAHWEYSDQNMQWGPGVHCSKAAY